MIGEVMVSALLGLRPGTASSDFNPIAWDQKLADAFKALRLEGLSIGEIKERILADASLWEHRS